MRVYVFALLVSVTLLASPAAAALEITECGTEVPENETGYLISDLDCSEADSEGVVLANGARLLLGGYNIVSEPGENARRQGVRCRTGSVCSVIGPGEISGFSASGIAGTRVRARDVAVNGNAVAGIIAYENIHLHNVVAEGNGVVGVHAGGKVFVRPSELGDLESAGFIESRAPRFKPARRSCSADPSQG
jgi:hypothetical protein